MTYTVDAKGKTLGRLSSEIARLLQGKDKAEYNPRLLGGDKVVVKNVRSLKFTGKKMEQKKYFHHTGYVGHLKTKNLGDVFASRPSWVLKRAVRGMLPKNKLAAKRLKLLVIEENE
ncbi:MAG: 50S ribosomal protein L13 [Patescibacteria group bacterium]|nr:50S ribosomal protein L13 [Patescibacteria group bacterium]